MLFFKKNVDFCMTNVRDGIIYNVLATIPGTRRPPLPPRPVHPRRKPLPPNNVTGKPGSSGMTTSVISGLLAMISNFYTLPNVPDKPMMCLAHSC